MSQASAQNDPMGFEAIQHYGDRAAAFYHAATEWTDENGLMLLGRPTLSQSDRDAVRDAPMQLVTMAMRRLGKAAEGEAFDPDPPDMLPPGDW